MRAAACCRPRANCRPTCGHLHIVEAYQYLRSADLAALEAVTSLYPGDVADYITRNGPPITFKQFLTAGRNA